MNSVLVTGGTGSFGQAFIRHLLRQNNCPNRICIFSRGEHAQAAMRATFNNDPRLRFFIGDVRDRNRLTRAMEGVDTVIHAAALKRIEVGAYNPSEMVATNVLGTMNVIDAALDAEVQKVVYLSSDKAYQPISPYGQSKALAESLILAANQMHGTRFAVTRYGNVAGSAGSVIPLWRKALAERTGLTITDPDCTRFWMTMGQAISLVTMAASLMPDYPLIPHLPAYRLGDLAIAMGVADAEIAGHLRQTQLPAWEKQHESMESGNCSADARRMSVEELMEALKDV